MRVPQRRACGRVVGIAASSAGASRGRAAQHRVDERRARAPAALASSTALVDGGVRRRRRRGTAAASTPSRSAASTGGSSRSTSRSASSAITASSVAGAARSRRRAASRTRARDPRGPRARPRPAARGRRRRRPRRSARTTSIAPRAARARPGSRWLADMAASLGAPSSLLAAPILVQDPAGSVRMNCRASCVGLRPRSVAARSISANCRWESRTLSWRVVRRADRRAVAAVLRGRKAGRLPRRIAAPAVLQLEPGDQRASGRPVEEVALRRHARRAYTRAIS